MWLLSLWQCFTLIFFDLHSHHSIKAHCYPEQIKTNIQVGIKCLAQEPFSSTDRWTRDSVNSYWRCIKATLPSVSEYIIIGAGLQLNKLKYCSWFWTDITNWFSKRLVNRNNLNLVIGYFTLWDCIVFQTITSESNNTVNHCFVSTQGRSELLIMRAT